MKKQTNVMTAQDSVSNYRYYFSLLFNRIANMFEWSGLPEAVDEQYLAQLIFLTGRATFLLDGGKIYIANCARGGQLNEYYFPTNMILANPVLGSREMTIGTDCAVIWTSTTDKLRTGESASAFIGHDCPTYCLIDKTAHLLAECMSSINIAQVNTRASYLITAQTKASKDSAELAMKSIYKGEPFIVANSNMVGEINALPLANTQGVNTLKELRELHQYYLSQFYHAIGVNSNANYKRERIIKREVEADEEPLQINIKDMLCSVKRGVEDVNALFGTSIAVDLADEWKNTSRQIEEEGGVYNKTLNDDNGVDSNVSDSDESA